MRAGARLQLRQQVADVLLDRLLREEEALADLAIHEPVGDQLENLELAARRLLLELLERAGERDHLGPVTALCRNRLEAARMIAIPVQDLIALSSVHDPAIGRVTEPL